MGKMKIDIWADIACPYCYVGKKKLEAALQAFPHADQIELVWHSYELNPDLKNEPLNSTYLDYYKDKQEELNELQKLAQATGIRFNFENLVITSTSDALRTIKLGRKYHLEGNTFEAFFFAYFTEGKCISDREVIKEIALNVGLPVEELMTMLDGNEFLTELTEDIRYSEDQLNLEYIPFYLFNNKTIIQGSISGDVYLETLKKTFDDWKSNGVSTQTDHSVKGIGCSIDGKGCR